MNLKTTALFDLHCSMNAKMAGFGGWHMPISYTSVLREHQAVRKEVGLFDVSHMGQLFVSGEQALDLLQMTTINDVKKLSIGHGQYSAILNDTGGMIDDLILYRLSNTSFLLCVNAANIEKDLAWLKSQSSRFKMVSIDNESNQWAQLALQGPNSLELLDLFFEEQRLPSLSSLPYTHLKAVDLFGHLTYFARTGYTGELGFEIYLPNSCAERVWEFFIKRGASPIGLGARDTLRLEACYLLYGNDMNEVTTPLEAGIGWATKFDKGDFVGRPQLLDQKSAGVKKRIYAFKLQEPGVPRHDMTVLKGSELVGKVTSGSILPTVGGAGGMAMLETAKVKIGDRIEIDVRGKRKLAQLVKRPLYSAKVKGA